MKKIHIMGWLVMAAAFITTFTACSSDDAIEEPKAPVRTISVTVGAGIINPATTRSGIIEGTHTMKFTIGDKLFVRAMYGNEVGGYYQYMLRGFLDMNGSPSLDGKSASFSGTLTQYERGAGNSIDGFEYTDVVSIPVSFTSDPIGEANGGAYATLVHKDAILGTDYTDYGWDIEYAFDQLAPDVNTLMTKYLTVTSSSLGTGYDSDTKSFTLDDPGVAPIINCTINGLTANAIYTVTYTYGDDEMPLSPMVTTDGNGTAKFAFFGTAEGMKKHVITLKNTTDNSDTMTADLEEKDLGAKKIYNVTWPKN